MEQLVLNPMIAFTTKVNRVKYDFMSDVVFSDPVMEALFKLNLKKMLIKYAKTYEQLPDDFNGLKWDDYVNIYNTHIIVTGLEDRTKVSFKFQCKFYKQLLPYIKYAIDQIKKDAQICIEDIFLCAVEECEKKFGRKLVLPIAFMKSIK